MKKILLADDHEIVRFGLALILGQFFPGYTIDEAEDAEGVMRLMKKNDYSLLLLDLIMPGNDGNTLLHYVANFHPLTKVLVLSMNDETLYGMRTLQLGAKGYLKKDAPKEEIVKAIQTILDGKKYIGSKLADTLLQSSLDGKELSSMERLTPREFQVAMYMIQDFSQKQISEMLHVQYGTVNTLKQRIYEKLDIEHRKELVELAAAHGLK
jgi:two-component system, NarL family, invasion response regulator UvrY